MKNFAWLFMLAAMPVFVACGDDEEEDSPKPNTEQNEGDDENLVAPSVSSTGNAPAGVVAVDLGLPSGTKWANMNVGATCPEEAGEYFRWGETKPSKDGDTDASYPYFDVDLGESIAGTKYDAATANWGASWKMPTYEQFKELIDNCTNTWTTLNNVNGDKVTGPNGTSVFFPASGYRDYSVGSLNEVGTFGFYWSATPYSNTYVRTLYFNSSGWTWNGYSRARGYSVRAVAK